MKTVILDDQKNVLNVAVGIPEDAAPEGMTYVVVEDGVWVGPGCKQADDGSYYDPNPIPRED